MRQYYNTLNKGIISNVVLILLWYIFTYFFYWFSCIYQLEYYNSDNEKRSRTPWINNIVEMPKANELRIKNRSETDCQIYDNFFHSKFPLPYFHMTH